jgi:hypothetical protein
MTVYLPRSEYPAPNLDVSGFCDKCKQWLPLGDHDWLPKHTFKNKKKCPNSEYSPSDMMFLVNNEEEAKKTSLFLRDDKGWCLDPGYIGSTRHSANCGDGRACDETRRKIASALAIYYLEKCVGK